ncbi:MAG: TetR/AcrR family transcriptional regulator [Clostridia bacterium]|nr:TetR/AcrR family transcriptional regulator [Clostridia bacterium]
MNKAPSTDRRVIKTRKAIRNAFAKLLSCKDINDITVSDIAELADINRKTFYNYYPGIHKVIDEIENDIVDSFSSVLGEINYRDELENPYTIFEKLTSIINTDMDFYCHFFTMNGNTNMINKIVTLLKEKTKAAMISQTGIDETTAETALTFMLCGMMAVFQSWFNSDRKRSIEEISEMITIISFKGLNGIINT